MKVCERLGPGYTSINSGKNAFNPYNSVTKLERFWRFRLDRYFLSSHVFKLNPQPKDVFKLNHQLKDVFKLNPHPKDALG
jgi:hypothetical protein